MLCLIAGVTVWAIVPKWVDVGSLETAKQDTLDVSTRGELRIRAEQTSAGEVPSLRIDVTANPDTSEPGNNPPSNFHVTREVHGPATLQFSDLAAGWYEVKVTPAKGSTWLVDVKDHRSWWSLPW